MAKEREERSNGRERAAVASLISHDELSTVQASILDHIEAQPGVSIQAIAEEEDIAHLTARYHVSRLADWDLIRQVRDGRKIRNVPQGCKQQEALLRSVLASEQGAKVLEYLATNRLGLLSVNQVAEEVGVSFGTVKRALERLERADVLAIHRNRSRYHLEAKQDLATILDEEQR